MAAGFAVSTFASRAALSPAGSGSLRQAGRLIQTGADTAALTGE